MAAKKKGSAFDYITELLRKNRKAEYKDVAAAAKKRGYTIYPIQYGRAQALLGIVKPGKKKAAGRSGRPKRTATTLRSAPARSGKGTLDNLEGLIGGLKDIQRDRDQLRTTLEKIRDLVDRAL